MWAVEQLTKHNTSSIIRDARDYAISQGIVLRNDRIPNGNCAFHTPMTLLPSPFPERLYDMCLTIHPHISSLMLELANNFPFMENSLKSVIEVDDFTANLLNVQRMVEREGLAQPIRSCINRSDYMLDSFEQSKKPSLRIRQVEVNAIASAMSHHCCRVHRMHEYLMSKYDVDLDKIPGVRIPSNDSLEFIAEELINLYDLYGNRASYILLINEKECLNFSEQFSIELAIYKERPNIKVLRRRFMDLPNITKLGPNKELFVDGKYEIALVYFRYGYDPSNYDFPGAWDLRLFLERSKAIKCPSIGFHVSGIKKFQQIFSTKEQIEKFLHPEQAQSLSEITCKFWSIEGETETGREGYKVGLERGESLVLKPQREGGGHNIYGKNVRPYLEKIANSRERQQYILMELIKSPLEYNWFLHPADHQDSDVNRLQSFDSLISELGIYGSIVTDSSGIISNRSAGYLVRSKKYGVDEGGVAAGHSGISSIILINDEEVDIPKFYQFQF